MIELFQLAEAQKALRKSVRQKPESDPEDQDRDFRDGQDSEDERAGGRKRARGRGRGRGKGKGRGKEKGRGRARGRGRGRGRSRGGENEDEEDLAKFGPYANSVSMEREAMRVLSPGTGRGIMKRPSASDETREFEAPPRKRPKESSKPQPAKSEAPQDSKEAGFSTCPTYSLAQQCFLFLF